MPKVFVLTHNNLLAASIERFLRYTRGIEPIRILLSEPLSTDRTDQIDYWVLRTFHQIADSIEDNKGENGLRNAIAIIDFCDEDWGNIKLAQLNPIRDGKWSAVVAMLILAFPEIHWVFITPYKAIDAFLFKQAHMFISEATSSSGDASSSSDEKKEKSFWNFLRIHDEGFTTLFDPTGLRNEIRQRIRETKENGQKVAPYVPVREQIAAAIDEEEPYAYFNAYTAYRFGFRIHAVTSYAMMEKLFHNKWQKEWQKPELVFEDIYLNFPDRPLSSKQLSPDGKRPKRLSDLEERDRYFTRLSEVKYRIFITVGHKRTLEPDTWQTNKAHLQTLRGRGQHNKILYKPFSGIFDLWQESRLYRWLKRERRLRGERPKGLAAGYEWPPPKPKIGEPAGHHSAPGRLLEVANRLIQRAEQILHSTKTVEDSVYGATLALEAQELLGNRTPTTALEALAIRQQLEVIAESMFYGVETHLNVKDRFKEIEREVQSVGYWFNPRTRQAAELNARIGIVNQLVLRFREYNQFDEEHDCLNEIRKLERKLGLFHPDIWTRIRAMIAFPFRWYVESLLGAIRWFIVALIGWVVFFTILYWGFCNVGKKGLWHGLGDTISSFVGLQPPHDLSTLLEPGKGWALGLSMAAIVLGFVHLGIFISHLYSMIARR